MKSASEKSKYFGIQRIVCALMAVFLVATVFATSVSDHDAAEEIVVLDDVVIDENLVIDDEVVEDQDIIVEPEEEEVDPEVIEEPEEEEVEPQIIVLPEEEEVEEEEPEVPNPQPQAGPIRLVIGTDSNQYKGDGMGYLYRSGTRYYSYDAYNMNNYVSGTNYERRGRAVFDLSDLTQYKGITITSGEIWWRHDYRRAVGQLDFWTMDSIPYDRAPSATAKALFDEIGGPGSVKLGSEMFSGNINSNNFDVNTAISSGGITWLNSKLSSSDYDVAIGGDVYSLISGTYGYVYCYDVRLVLYVTYSEAESAKGEIAVGDDLSGYVYRTGTNYDIGRIYSSSNYYRAYAVWDPAVVMGMIPSDGADVTVTGVTIRLNSPYGYLNTLGVYHMDRDPRTGTGVSIFTDARDGTQYYNNPSGGYISAPQEFEWDLGPAGLSDFIDTLDGSPNFFALGFSRTTSYNYMYSARLVIEYEIDVAAVGGPTANAGPDMTADEGDNVILDGSGSVGNLSKVIAYEWDFDGDGSYDYFEGIKPVGDKTLQLGADNPEHDGQAMGYSRQSGSYYYLYPYYYTYAYYRPGSTDYHGWVTFDLADLNQWSGATVKDAKLLIHNWYRYYVDELVFTALETTPNYYGSTATKKKVFDESGSTGTQIGVYDSTSNYDTNRYSFEVDLNSDGVAAINDVLTGSPTYYTFGVGLYVKSLHSGYSYGYVRWTDVRLVVTFEVDDDLEKTQSGDGIAFGDDWSGHIYGRTSGSRSDRPYGYMYTRKSSSYEYRSYAQWDVGTIADVLPSNVEIKNVGLRINHRYSSMSNVYVYPMTTDVETASPSAVFTDIGDGTPYAGPNSLSSSYSEYEWDLGTNAVNDLQDALDNSLAHFGIGYLTTSTSGYGYDFSPRLVIEWDSTAGGGGPAVDGIANHTYGDNGVYEVKLRVYDKAGLKDTDTCNVTIVNIAPTITPFGPYAVDEGTPLSVGTDAADIGSDDLSFRWQFELSSTYTNMHYADGIGPDPYPSPYGTFPVSASDSITHSHGDNGVYNLILTVTDDDGGSTSYTTTVTVYNVAPTIAPFGPFSVNEGTPLTMDVTASDLGSDDLTYEWVFEMGPTTTNTHFNDGTGPDPSQSPWGSYPFMATDTVTQTYGDNDVYGLTVTVTDDDGASAVFSTIITVNNVDPTVGLNAYVLTDFTLRVSGEKWHDVELYVLRNSYTLGYARVLRMPGDPDDQALTITGIMCDVTKRVTTKVVYTPFDDVINGQINGADPVWVTLTFENGDEFTYDHTFNYNHPEAWEWDSQINQFFVGHEMTFEGTAFDLGSDDLMFTWEWGDGSPSEGSTYYNDGVGPDPTKSPDGTFPFVVTDTKLHTYWAPMDHTLKLTVEDDDGGSVVVYITIYLT
jgi:hypothetical protein